jgi:hypothetical protein
VGLLAEVALAYGEIGLWQVRRYGVVDEHIVQAITDALHRFDDGDSVFRAQLLTGLAMAIYYREGERDRGHSLAREAVGVARRLGDTALLATSLVEFIMMLDATPDPTEQLEAGRLHDAETSELSRGASAVPCASRGTGQSARRSKRHRRRRERSRPAPRRAAVDDVGPHDVAFLQDGTTTPRRLAGGR